LRKSNQFIISFLATVQGFVGRSAWSTETLTINLKTVGSEFLIESGSELQSEDGHSGINIKFPGAAAAQSSGPIFKE
jgi:hypothetical protein